MPISMATTNKDGMIIDEIINIIKEVEEVEVRQAEELEGLIIEGEEVTIKIDLKMI